MCVQVLDNLLIVLIILQEYPGFVGINTMFPSYTLDVAGNIRATGNLRVEGITTILLVRKCILVI
jgi:hypothetical protein